MQNVKILARVLFYITRLLSFFYFIMAAFSGFALVSGWSLNIKENGKYFQVYFPFTKTAVLNGDYNLTYILLEFLAPLALYGLFAVWLSNVFKVFFQPKLFTEPAVKHLKRFYLANFIIPGIMVLLVSMIDRPDIDNIPVIILHGIIGVFAYFLAAIFKKGVSLQKEQDLII